MSLCSTFALTTGKSGCQHLAVPSSCLHTGVIRACRSISYIPDLRHVLCHDPVPLCLNPTPPPCAPQAVLALLPLISRPVAGCACRCSKLCPEPCPGLRRLAGSHGSRGTRGCGKVPVLAGCAPGGERVLVSAVSGQGPHLRGTTPTSCPGCVRVDVRVCAWALSHQMVMLVVCCERVPVTLSTSI